jgi:hypothetical protein
MGIVHRIAFQALRLLTTCFLIAFMSFFAFWLGWFGGDDMPGHWVGRRIWNLTFPALPFAVGGFLAPRLYRTKFMGSLILAGIGANALFHYYGCRAFWTRSPTRPAYVFDSIWIDIGYHVALIALSCGVAACTCRKKDRMSGGDMKPIHSKGNEIDRERKG